MPSVKVRFYQYFDKQPNSTKVPSDQDIYTEYTCKMWDGCSYMAPVIALDMTNGITFGDPHLFRYCYIEQLHRYYWVADWKFTEGVWFGNLTVDVLGSFKDVVGSARMFADRLADRLDESGNFVDTGLQDNMIPTRLTPMIIKETTSLTHLHGDSFFTGTYVVGIINSDDNAVGAVSYYAMDNNNFRRFMKSMLSGSYLGTADIDRETQKAILNPFQYVATCNWFPFTITQITAPLHVNPSSYTPTARDSLALGWWVLPDYEHGGPRYYNINTYGKYMAMQQFQLIDHPLSGRLNMRMWNYDPYTQYQFTCPYFGNFTLDRSDMPDGLGTLLFSYDLVSGLAQLRIYNGQIEETGVPLTDVAALIGSKKLIRTLSGQVACPIQIAQTTSDYGAAKVTQIQARATTMGNSAALQREYTSAVNAYQISKAGEYAALSQMGGSLASLNVGGFFSGFGEMIRSDAQRVAAARDWFTTNMFSRPATQAANYAARASATHTSATQRAPVVETSGNNGSNLEAQFPFEQRASFLLPTTITGDNYLYTIPEADVQATKTMYNWVGYPHGRWIQVNRHSGYVQGHDPFITSTVATQSELDSIKSYISNGIFYE